VTQRTNHGSIAGDRGGIGVIFVMHTSVHAGPGRSTDACSPPDLIEIELSTLDGFALCCGGIPVDLPLGAQRLMAFLAVHNRPSLRTFVAGTLWQDTTERRASANLRSALWRLNQPGHPLIVATPSHLRLGPAVVVDFKQLEMTAEALLAQRIGHEVFERLEPTLLGDFLPDWTDDWVLIERERFRQLRLHALEALCEQLTDARRFGQAIQAGLAAVAGEPLRESAHRAVIKAYLAEGNRSEAIRQYDIYRRLAYDELDVEPSRELRALMNKGAASAERWDGDAGRPVEYSASRNLRVAAR
jgi:DNA-binding SARP family transcriptional activator